MARRTSTTVEPAADETTDSTDTPVTDEAVEAEDTDTDTDTDTDADTDEVPDLNPVEDAEGTDESAPRDPSGDTVHTDGQVEPAEYDLTPFTELAAEVVAGVDASTGDLPEGGLDRVLEAYRNLPDTKVRNRAKKHLNEQMAKGLEALDMGVAKGYLTLHDNMTTTTAKAGGGTTRQPADPKARWQQQLEIVTLAYGELFSQRPEGVDDEQVNAIVQGVGSLAEQVAAYRAYLDTPAPEVAEGEEAPEPPKAPEVDDKVVAAFRLVRGGKSGGRSASASIVAPHTGPRRDIGKHIQSAFADVEPGTFLTVAQIRAHASSEYEAGQASAGAISARLFPASGQSTVEGVTPGMGGDKNQRGATKNAA